MLDKVAEAVPYRIVEVSGTPYERGTAYGEAIKDMLPRFLREDERMLEGRRSLQPEGESWSAVIEVILAAAPGGGFVLSTSGGIYRTDCYDNVVTYIETAHQFGAYPINTSRLKAELRQSSP